MAELIAAAAAAYLGYKAARKVRSAYYNAKEEMYEQQGVGGDYYTTRAYDPYQHTRRRPNSYYSSEHHRGRSYYYR